MGAESRRGRLRLGASWGLRELGLERVVAEADPGNAASIRAIEKAGFRREGVRGDKATFVLLADDVA